MAKDAYTLKRIKNTEELHLFKGEFTEEDCTAGQFSLCGQISKDDSDGNIFACKTEEQARIECAKIGRKVCGTCVSNLYGTC